MTLSEFVSRSADMKDETVKQQMIYVFHELADRIKNNDADYARNLLEDGIFDSITLLEQDDAFGTEGLEV